MSQRTSARWNLCWLLCVGCAGAQGTTANTPVIIAGSVCSGQVAIDPATLAPIAVPPTAALVAFVTESTPSELGVYELASGRVRFHVPVSLGGRPQILQDVVVATDSQGQLTAFDLLTGARRWSAPARRPSWLGAVQVGPLVISTSSSLSFRPAERGSTVSAFDARSGSLVWERQVSFALSAPAAIGGKLFLISDHADVWSLDARSGADAGCTGTSSGPLDWLVGSANGLYLGAADARSLSASQAVKLSLPIDALPGRPQLHASSYDAVPAARSAHGRVGVVARLDANAGALRLMQDEYYFVFYRDLFAYRGDGQLLWARLLDADVVRAEASDSGPLLLADDGSLLRLSATTGAELGRVRLSSARIASGDIASSAAISDGQAPPANTAASAVAQSLRSALMEIALDTDARLLPARSIAVTSLAALPEPAITQDLLRIYTQPGVPLPLRERIAAVLPTRKLGSEFLVDALLEDYDFLEDRAAPPLAAIVPALVATHETRAVPRLVERLFDPDTRLDELLSLVDAIASLGDASAAEPLARFLAMYHADSALSDDPAALLAAARALRARGGAANDKLLQAVAGDTSTLPALRANLAELNAPKVAALAAPPTAAPAANEAQADLPEMLSDEAVQRALSEHADDLRTCAIEELARDPNLHALRLSFVVKNDGSFSGLAVLPEHAPLLQCLRGRLTTLRFPAFRAGRRLASYTVAVHPNADLGLPANDATAARPFWKLSEMRAGPGAKVPSLAPWWQDQNPLFVAVEDAPRIALPSSSVPSTPAASGPKKPAAAATEPKPPAQPVNEDAWWLPTHKP
jgi:hypothetical protein